MSKHSKVFIICSTLGLIKRGYERYAQELFDRLSAGTDHFYLIKGFGKKKRREVKLLNPLSLKSPVSQWLHRLFPNKPRYYFHAMGYCLPLTFLVLLHRPQIIYVLEMALYKYLLRLKRAFKLKYQLITFSGGQLPSRFPFDEDCYLHHVTPFYLESATAMGLPKEQQFLIPHFVDDAFLEIPKDPQRSAQLKKALGISPETKVIISVGNLDTTVKRMDHLIRELEGLNGSIHLILLGQTAVDTPQVIDLGEQILGRNNFTCTTVDKSEIHQYYDLADIFVLCSLMEGFGLVYLEALSRGLPVIAHDFPIARYVLKEHGTFVDMRKKGALKLSIQKIIEEKSSRNIDEEASFVRQHYSWKNLKESYLAMFNDTNN